MRLLPGRSFRTAAALLFRAGTAAVLVALLALQLVSTPQAYVAGQPGRLLLQPATGTMTTGQNFTVDIMFNTAGQAISGIASRVTFAGTDLQAISITGNNDLGSGWSFPITDIESSGGQTRIDLMAINQSTTGFTASTNTKIATITFRAVSAFSNKAVSFDLTTSQILRKSDAADILGGVTNGTFSATGGTVTPEPTPTPTPTPTPEPTATPVGATPTPTPPITGGLTDATPTPTPDSGSTFDTGAFPETDTGVGGAGTTTGQPDITQPVPETASPQAMLLVATAGIGLLGTGSYTIFKRKRRS